MLDLNQKLSKNFRLYEFTKSQTATRKGIFNTPTQKEIDFLRALCVNVLQPIRDKFGAMSINSGYRCLSLNRAIGSSDTSDHVRGFAGDIEIMKKDNLVVAKWIRDNLKFKKLILEGYEGNYANEGWIHIAYDENNLMNSVFTASFQSGVAVYSIGL